MTVVSYTKKPRGLKALGVFVGSTEKKKGSARRAPRDQFSKGAVEKGFIDSTVQ